MKFIYLLILPVFLFSQASPTYMQLFPVGSDTIANGVSNPDTVKYRVWIQGVAGTWHTVTTYIDTTTKQAETGLDIELSADSNWRFGENLEILIQGQAGTISSNLYKMGNKQGSVTAIFKVDTTGTNALYNASVIGGN